jgi:hypothetical protein
MENADASLLLQVKERILAFLHGKKQLPSLNTFKYLSLMCGRGGQNIFVAFVAFVAFVGPFYAVQKYSPFPNFLNFPIFLAF